MRKMDFLLVGFVKAGTSSLDSILRQDRRLILPQVKETHFFDWYREENALDVFWSTYYPKIRSLKLVGGIEPCYSRNAREVHDIFGEDVKLLFMMRNPILADYSLFKMALKYGSSKHIINWYKRYDASRIAEMYHGYTVSRIRRPEGEDIIRDEFRYEKWIKKYLEYYSIEQIKFFLFEDFVKEPGKTVREVEDFLGLKEKELNCNIWTNEGNAVSRNYICAKLNYGLTHISKPFEYKNAIVRSRIGMVQEKLFRFTLVRDDEKMLEKTEELLKKYYRSTKSYVENLFNRDLSDIWF